LTTAASSFFQYHFSYLNKQEAMTEHQEILMRCRQPGYSQPGYRLTDHKLGNENVIICFSGTIIAHSFLLKVLSFETNV
jgi:hypothetical protein